MEQIAFYSGGAAVYWSSVILTAAAVVALLFFLSFYLGRGGNAVAAFAAVPISIALSLVLARFVHWYSRTDSYDGFLTAMTDYSSGGFALLGVFAGCLLGACLTRILFLHRNLPKMLDCMSVAACAGLTLGRLAGFFSSTDRGQVVQSVKSLPWVYPVINAVSGQTEYRLATFLLQAMAALVLFAVLTILSGNRKRRDGDLTLMFLMLYGASQVVLDSTRYDSLFFRSNGFVSIVQVFGAVALVVGIVLLSRSAVRKRGMRLWFVPLWILIAASLGGAGFMEYYVQRRGNEAVFAYSVMSACLAFAIALACVFRAYSYGGRKK